MGDVTRYEPAAPLVPVSTANESGAAVLAARAKAEVEARALVAINRPRNLDTFRVKLLSACKRSRFAATARYSKPVGGKAIVGMSARFAEECARHYGNLDVSTMVVSEDDERRVIRVSVTDLEVNLPWSSEVVVGKTVERRSAKPGDEVVRQRMNSKGEPVFILKADEDALLVKQAALVSKAARNLIMKHIPSDIVEEATEVVLATMRDEDQRDPTAARKRIVDAFYELGVMPKQLEDLLGVASLEVVTTAQVQLLRTIYTGMKDEGVRWEEVVEEFGRRKAGDAPAGKPEASRLKDKLKQQATTTTTKSSEPEIDDAALDAELATQESDS